MTSLVCEITWALQDGALIAVVCSDCGATHAVTTRAVLDAWADAHSKAAHPSAERVSVIRVVR